MTENNETKDNSSVIEQLCKHTQDESLTKILGEVNMALLNEEVLCGAKLAIATINHDYIHVVPYCLNVIDKNVSCTRREQWNVSELSYSIEQIGNILENDNYFYAWCKVLQTAGKDASSSEKIKNYMTKKTKQIEIVRNSAKRRYAPFLLGVKTAYPNEKIETMADVFLLLSYTKKGLNN